MAEKEIFVVRELASLPGYSESINADEILRRLEKVVCDRGAELYVVSEIRELLKDVSWDDPNPVDCERVQLTEIVDHKKIVDALTKSGRQPHCAIGNAMRMVFNGVATGVLDEVGGILVYLDHKNDGEDLCLELRRRGDGIMILDVRKIVSIREFHQRYSILLLKKENK